MPPDITTNHLQSQFSDSDKQYNARNIREVGEVCKRIDALVHDHVTQGNFVLVLGGDHCIPIGSIPPILRARPNTGVVWVDAHADINTPEQSHSGNMHGMYVLIRCFIN
jgi:arginase